MDAPGAVSKPENDQGPWWEAQAWALTAEADRKADRKRRREGTTLIIVSAVFVLVSVLCLFVDQLMLIGLVCLVFFGGCLLAGIMMRGDPDSQTTLVPSLRASVIMGLGCGLIFVLALMAVVVYGASVNQIAVLVVAAVGFVFFGIGGIVALVRRHRRRRTQLQNERPHRQGRRP